MTPLSPSSSDTPFRRDDARGAADFLAGGGDMGRRMRAFDWATTPLGPPVQWPQSLKTIVRVMLDSRFAMWMMWGPARSFFCNDAYLPTVGDKRDWVLGAPADTVWSEIWADVGPRIDSVLATGTATWDEGLRLFLERRGFIEESFHTFSYSPVYDDGNAVAGMLCVVAEETERVLGERRLHVLRDMAAQSKGSETARRVCRTAARLLDTAMDDVAFAGIYLLEPDRESARLVAATATCPRPPGAARITLHDDGGLWPLRQAMSSDTPIDVDDLQRRVGRVTDSPWPEPLVRALVLPLKGSGQTRAVGFLVAGISPRLALNDQYRGFLGLLATQLAAALADAEAYEAESRRAQALAELDRSKTVFFSNVSHELRTPLTLMLGPLQDLLATPALATDVREPLQMVRRNAERLLKLVNSLLDFSRLEAGRVQASFRPTDLAALTTDLCSVFRAAIERAGLRFVVDCPAGLPPVFVDRDMWERVVLNFLSNALKFTFDGAIAVRLRANKRSVVMEVEDTGVGIPADALPQMFVRFHRVAGTRSRSHEGSGIGLALVKELVRLHGGTVDVDSEVGRGTRFTVRVPVGSEHLPQDRIAPADTGGTATVHDSGAVYVAEAQGDVQTAFELGGIAGDGDMPAPATADGTARRPRILVADDNADMRSYLVGLLEPAYQVRTVPDGAAALAAIATDLPQLVVTDVMMPGLDGFQLLAALRADVATRELPVIVLSARAGEESRVEGLERGADDYLPKPFSARELKARIETQLARAELRSLQALLDRRLADVFRHAPVGVALLHGPQHVFEFANANYQRLVFGRAAVGVPVAQALPEIKGQGIVDLLDTVYATGRPYIGRSVKIDLFEADGQTPHACFFDFVYQPIRDTDGQVDGIAVVAFDVSELDAARREAEAANRSKDEFMAMLGHELRNPLAPIVTALRLMQLRAPDALVRERSIVERQVRHMARLVDDLLDVSRITSGKITLRKTRIELAAAVTAALETASPLFEERRHTVSAQVPAQGLDVEADLVRLTQIVSNLLTNAGRYTPPGGHIEITAQRVRGDDHGSVLLTVEDNGVGIGAEMLPRVFDLFVQGRQSSERSEGGLGLGLAIAQTLARMHGGLLRAHSDGEGRGSRFTLQLPASAAAAAAAQATDTAPTPEPARRHHVLVVDDNRDAADALAMLLGTDGHAVRTAYDGPQALALIDDPQAPFVPDLAVLDIGLPVMDGIELTRLLKQRPALKAMKVIAITGYGQDTDRRRSADAGIDAHLVKPVDVDELGAVIDGLLGTSPKRG